MYLHYLYICVSIFLSGFVFYGGKVLGKKAEGGSWGASPFECGIPSFIKSNKPVSMRFFLLSVIFLIFDVELILIYPVFLEWFKFFVFSGIWTFFIFLLVITWGLFWEWAQLMLEWSK